MKDSKNRHDRRTMIVVVLCVVYVILYWRRLLLGSQLPFDGNVLRLFYPSWIIGKNLLNEGFYFLWDPARNMGQPFLASPQNQALYPLRLFSPLLNYLDYQRVSIVFHTLLASLFGYLLAKKWIQNEAAAWVAAVGLGFNGFFFARVTPSSDFATMAWTPVVLYFLWTKKPIWLGVTLSMQWMAGFPPFFILTGLVLVVICFLDRHEKARFLCLIKGGVIFLGLSAVQIIPFLEMLKEAHRPLWLPGAAVTQFSLHPLELGRQLFTPSFLLTTLPPMTSSDPSVTGFYVGPVFIFLFVVGVLKGGRREKILCGMTLISFVLAMGKYIGFYEWIPFIRIFRFPSHWLLLAITGLILVGAWGMSRQ